MQFKWRQYLEIFHLEAGCVFPSFAFEESSHSKSKEKFMKQREEIVAENKKNFYVSRIWLNFYFHFKIASLKMQIKAKTTIVSVFLSEYFSKLACVNTKQGEKIDYSHKILITWRSWLHFIYSKSIHRFIIIQELARYLTTLKHWS